MDPLTQLLNVLGIDLETLIKILIFPGAIFIFLLAMFAVWLERKVLARVHLRIGPLHVGKYAGSLQVIADFIKLLSKEIIIPKKADKTFFVAMPVIGVAVASLGYAVIPFAENWMIFKFDLSLLFALALFSLFPIITLLTGWASNNKYSFIGGIRAALQLLAYEVPLYLSMLGIVMISRSLDLVEIVKAQSNLWFIVLQPLGFIIYFVATLGELERIPFDIPEAEQEIVVGWLTEYSGILYGLFMTTQYICIGFSAFLTATLYLGGWYGPAFLPPVAWTVLKGLLIITAIIIIRGAFPRVRMDQLLRIGWWVLIPLSIINLFLTLILIQYVPGIFGL